MLDNSGGGVWYNRVIKLAKDKDSMESLMKLEYAAAPSFQSSEEGAVCLELLSSVEKELELLDAEIIDISSMEEIRPDKWDTTIAVASGVLTGLIDSFFVGAGVFWLGG